MAQKKKTLNLTNILVVACTVSLIFLSASLIVYSQQNYSLGSKNSQIANLKSQLAATTPKLVSIDLQYTDNHSNSNAPFLNITGFVVNVGNGRANNCTIHVYAQQEGNVTALDTSKNITSLEAGADGTISLQFPYTGQSLVFCTSYLTWTN